MLSYRHAFHAGNHADVLKHLVLVHVLDYLLQKDKPLWYIDTHAGAGRYALSKGHATRLAEYEDGVARLVGAANAPAGVKRYLEVVRAIDHDARLRHYPGSPWIAQQLLRRDDRIWLHELHTTDHQHLRREFDGVARNVSVEQADGFDALKGLLPPQPRRGVVLMDPSYEVKTDYARVIATLRDALERFATGVYLVWHPLLARREAHLLEQRLLALPATRWLHATLSPRAPSSVATGLTGSGMYVINPPYTLEPLLQDCLPWLRDVLAQDAQASFTLEHGPD